eukprot:CAMPEP_0173177370 /NCGR_PEP_ID=MMETSP1141-20130122/4954_1 /TAXON_ID=483371 /ORGANISM="non described non described, Strain CCMP2298" /LENGTH=471 /DNA_ID=CAMNT_0014099765 /DNA_START=150 /DNA_END=1565 /DNA_ORIENTATION=+
MTRAELARIKQSIAPLQEDHSRVERKKELKAKSEERLKHWPNTLEALRLKKESFMKDREGDAEAKRQEVDREEAEIRRNARLEAIRKANDLIYAQTDKMKQFKSQKLYADVIGTRFEQADFKRKVKEDDKVKDVVFHEHILKEVARLEAIEKGKLEKTKQTVDAIKISRFAQLDDVRRRKAEIVEKELSDGIKSRDKAQTELETELQVFEERKKVASANNMRMLKANADLKDIRNKRIEEERLEEMAREAQVEGIEGRKIALKRLERERFERSQLTRQKLIDAAVEQLAHKTGHAAAILEKQVQDMKDKEDQRMAAKTAMLAADYENTVASRTAQVVKKQKEAAAMRIEDDRLVEKWRKENEDGIQAAKDKAVAARVETIRIKSMQKTDGEAVNRKKQEDKLREVEQTRFLQTIDTGDEGRFVEICRAEIERNIKMGKPVYTLLRALEFSAPPLLPARTIPLNGRKDADKD